MPHNTHRVTGARRVPAYRRVPALVSGRDVAGVGPVENVFPLVKGVTAGQR